MVCAHDSWNGRTLFCPTCDKVADRAMLRSVPQRLMGAVGVRHASSAAIERYWATGDPDTPGL